MSIHIDPRDIENAVLLDRERRLRAALLEFMRIERNFGHNGQHTDSECADCKRVRMADEALSYGYLNPISSGVSAVEPREDAAERRKAFEDDFAQLTAENERLRAAARQLLGVTKPILSAGEWTAGQEPLGLCCAELENVLATTSAPAVVPLAMTQLEADAEALAGLLESAVRILRERQYETGVSHNLIVNSEAVLCNYRSRHPLP